MCYRFPCASWASWTQLWVLHRKSWIQCEGLYTIEQSSPLNHGFEVELGSIRINLSALLLFFSCYISNKFDLFIHIFPSLKMPILNFKHLYFPFVCIVLNYSMYVSMPLRNLYLFFSYLLWLWVLSLISSHHLLYF
jgi:hypothetical protein